MKIFLVAMALAITSGEEPTEQQMQGAFSAALATRVQNVLEFIDEVEGPDAVARMRDAGLDRFVVQAFQKRNCRPDTRGHVCDFDVNVDLVSGSIRRTISGRFFNGAEGLVFADDSI